MTGSDIAVVQKSSIKYMKMPYYKTFPSGFKVSAQSKTGKLICFPSINNGLSV